jgi:predicted GNAT family N-acyltransferase
MNLIEILDEYIKLLSSEIGRTAIYLAERGEGASKEVYEKGLKSRKKIVKLKKSLGLWNEESDALYGKE